MLGRIDRQVKLWGFRIELEEIESAVLATGLVDAAFVEKAGSGPDAMLVGFVLPAGAGAGVPAEPASSLHRALAERLSRRLPSYMVPARWVVLSQVPIGPTGKVDRRELLARIS